ncbi:MAG: imidazole glycerol phosphate synthase subunit HisH [Pseudomonadota bacterium]
MGIGAKDTIAIIDYGSGNLRSAAKAFEHVIAENTLNLQVLVTDKADDVQTASHIVLPGQGAFGDCMAGLQAVDGMIDALSDAVLQRGRPFLGICVGMQLLADRGLEYGEHKGLGWIPGEVVPIEPSDKSLKIPHMGWNDTHLTDAGQRHSMLQGITKSSSQSPVNFYFVHSFMFDCKDQENILGQTNYGGDVTAIVGRENIVGVQFHPEKSHNDGLSLIKDFIRWKP